MKPQPSVAVPKSGALTPLDYMLAVMNDESADALRRDRMAVAAAPFVHRKPGEEKPGKKAQAKERAAAAGQGSEWGADLAYHAPN